MTSRVPLIHRRIVRKTFQYLQETMFCKDLELVVDFVTRFSNAPNDHMGVVRGHGGANRHCFLVTISNEGRKQKAAAFFADCCHEMAHIITYDTEDITIAARPFLQTKEVRAVQETELKVSEDIAYKLERIFAQYVPMPDFLKEA